MNSGNGGFLLNRRTEAVTASVAAAGFGAENLNTGDPNQRWKADFTGIIYISMEFEQMQTVSAVALVNHGISENEAMELILVDDGEVVFFNEPLTWRKKSLYHVFDPVATKKIIIKIHSAGSIYLGEFFVGESFVFPTNYAWGFVDTFNVTKSVTISDAGVSYETNAEATTKYRNFKISFHERTGADGIIYPMIEAGKKVFVPSFLKDESFFGSVTDKSVPVRRLQGESDFSISFHEDAIL